MLEAVYSQAAVGSPADAVIWEAVESQTSESATLSFSFVAFMMLATLIAAVGIIEDSLILIIGAMVVGPEFGPIAALCVAAVERRRDVFLRSLVALVVGFPLAMSVTMGFTWLMTALGFFNETMLVAERPLTSFIWRPDALSFIVAFLVYLSSPNYIMPLFTTSTGHLILGISGLWMAMGIFVMKKMINIEV